MPPKKPRISIAEATRRATVRANIFEAAHAAIDWETFRWHSATGEAYDSYKPQSSQALTIDVFGTLQVSASRDAVLSHLAAHLGLPAAGPWQVSLEWHDPDNLLREKQPTWVDAVAQGAESLIFFEGKFTESDGGGCSQTHVLREKKQRGLRQCNGSYMWQTNPVNQLEARCALSAKGIRYWELIPQVFDYDADGSYIVCPFAGAWFQWMRNLIGCYARAQHLGLRPAFVVAYADVPGLGMARRVQSPEWERLHGRLQPNTVSLHTLSYQSLIALAQAAAPTDPVWPALAAWVAGKLAHIVGE